MVKRTAQTRELAERNARIKRLHEEHYTYGQIASMVDLTPLRVKDIVRDPYSDRPPQERVFNLSEFVPATDLAQRAVQMKQLRDQGLTLEEIGKLFHVTRERVRQVISQLAAHAQQQSAPVGGE